MAEVHIIGQIVSAEEFQSNRLLCRWLLQLGGGWKLVEGESEGQTQTDLPIMDSAYFCHPLDLHLTTRSIQSWPRIHLEIWHHDEYNRQEIYGYGTVFIPSTPGEHLIKCHCWRPKGGFLDETMQKFIGGGMQLRSTHVLDDANERMKLHTVTAGVVLLRLSVITRHFDRFGFNIMGDQSPLFRRANSAMSFDVADMRQPLDAARCNTTNPSTSRTAPFDGEVGQSQCVTSWEPVHLRQEWTIENISRALDLSTPGICLRSRAFRADAMPDITWQLCLYPGGKREENRGNVSLFLKMSTTHASREFTVRAEYCFFFTDEQGKSKFHNVNTGDFKVKPSKGSHSWGLRNIPRNKVTYSIRQDDTLRIVCQIETVPDFNKITASSMRKTDYDQTQMTTTYLNRINEMYRSGEGSDFTIECDRQRFAVHKFILSAHSEVFRAMFKHSNTVENRDSRVVLTDTNPTAIGHMLTYIYSGSLPEDVHDEQAPALMQIAEKYGIDQLKTLCQYRMISRLSEDNVCTMLEIADTYNAELLMEACIPVVKANGRRIVNSQEWSEVRSCNPQLITTILEKIVAFEEAPPNKRVKLNGRVTRE